MSEKTIRLRVNGNAYEASTEPRRSLADFLRDTLDLKGTHVGCEQGVCGTCLTGVLEGEPDHRDIYLTDEEKQAGDKMLPCVSRAKSSALVLDV